MQRVEYAEFSTLVRDAHNAIKKATGIEFLTIVQEGYSAHFHLWFFPWTPGVIQNHGRPCLTTMRGIMSDYAQHTLEASEWKTLERSIEKIKTLMAG